MEEREKELGLTDQLLNDDLYISNINMVNHEEEKNKEGEEEGIYLNKFY